MDPSSGALTRAYTETLLQEHFETFARHKVPFGVLVMQVDSVEQLKAKHGAGAVTAVMKLVAHTLLNGLRGPDQLGRWSDTEYLVIAAECGHTEIARVAERLRKMVNAAEAEWWGDHLRVTLSVGASAVQDDDTVQTLLERAERGLQNAATNGGNQPVNQL